MKQTRWQKIRSWLRRRGLPVALAGCLALALAGCGAKPAASPPAEPVPPVVQPDPEPPKPPEPRYFAPLTGEGLQEKVEYRPIMVMINNHPAARPQSGLTQADILFEVLAEGEVTRLVALFQSRDFDDPIGPVRSIRPYFIEIGKSFGAIQAHAGGSPDGYEKIRKEKIEALDEITMASSSYWRESFRKAPHNLYTNLDKLRTGAENRGYDTKAPATETPVFSFARTARGESVSAAAQPSTPVSRADITFLLQSYKVSYEWDEEKGVYGRLVNDKPHQDMDNDEQLTAANVIIMGARHHVLDSEGRRDVKLTGSGPAWILQDGKAVQGQWQRENSGAKFRFETNGKEVKLAPGQTHIMIVPLDPSFEEHITMTP